MKKNQGFTLLEVLITMVIMAIAFLGLAGLAARAMQFNESAYARSQAAAAAGDMVDRLRANRADALAGRYNVGFVDAASGSSVPALDIQAWREQLRVSLPSGAGSVSVEDGAATVIVRWNDSRAEGRPHVQQFQLETRL